MGRPELPFTKSDEIGWAKIDAQESSLLPNLMWPTIRDDKQRRYYNALYLWVWRRFNEYKIPLEDPLAPGRKPGTPMPLRKVLGGEFRKQWDALLILFGKPRRYPFITNEANKLAGFRNAPKDPVIENAGAPAIRKAIKLLCTEFGFPRVDAIFKKNQQRLADLVSASCDFKRCNRTTVATIYRRMRKAKELS